MTFYIVNSSTDTDNEDKQTLVGDFDYVEDDGDDQFTRHNSMDDEFLGIKKEIPRKEIFNFGFDDLNMKSHFVINHSRVLPAFMRFLYSGAWIIEAFQIPVIFNEQLPSYSPKRSSSSCSQLSSPVWIKSFLERSFLSPNMNFVADQWNNFINQIHTNEVNSIVNMESSSSFLLQLLSKHSSSSVDSVLLFVIAIALQSFCRSELFLHLSEQQWSTQAMLSAPWVDYSRVGRKIVMQHFSCLEAVDAHLLGTASLLDAMYERLLMTSNEQMMTSYLVSSFEGDFCWLLDLQECINILPVNLSVYENTTSGTTETFHVQTGAERPILPNELKSYFSLETTETISCSLQSSTAPISYVTPSSSNHMKDLFTCASPVLRCPLVVANGMDGSLSVYETENHKYRWNVHRMVFCQTAVSFHDFMSQNVDAPSSMMRGEDFMEKVRLRLQMTIQMSFLFSQILA